MQSSLQRDRLRLPAVVDPLRNFRRLMVDIGPWQTNTSSSQYDIDTTSDCGPARAPDSVHGPSSE